MKSVSSGFIKCCYLSLWFFISRWQQQKAINMDRFYLSWQIVNFNFEQNFYQIFTKIEIFLGDILMNFLLWKIQWFFSHLYVCLEFYCMSINVAKTKNVLKVQHIFFHHIVSSYWILFFYSDKDLTLVSYFVHCSSCKNSFSSHCARQKCLFALSDLFNNGDKFK